MEFLDRLGGRWNISLFHYRNHGSDFGRVLAGFEVPEADADRFDEFLQTLGYDYQLEERNAAYEMFLAGDRSAVLSDSKIPQQALGGFLEALVFRRPVGIERGIDRRLAFLARVLFAAHVFERLGEEEMRDDAVRVVGERLAQVHFRLLVAAAEQSRHLEVPAAERAIGGALQESRIELERRRAARP